jgi:hypothetical protein
MADIDEITRAVSKLPPGELAAFRAWFETFDAARFDRDIEAGAEAGKLDALAEQALADHRARRTRAL